MTRFTLLLICSLFFSQSQAQEIPFYGHLVPGDSGALNFGSATKRVHIIYIDSCNGCPSGASLNDTSLFKYMGGYLTPKADTPTIFEQLPFIVTNDDSTQFVLLDDTAFLFQVVSNKLTIQPNQLSISHPTQGASITLYGTNDSTVTFGVADNIVDQWDFILPDAPPSANDLLLIGNTGGVSSWTANLQVDGDGVFIISNSTVSAGTAAFMEDQTNGTNVITVEAPASVAADRSIVLPGVAPTNGYFVQTDGSGQWTYADVAASDVWVEVNDSTIIWVNGNSDTTTLLNDPSNGFVLFSGLGGTDARLALKTGNVFQFGNNTNSPTIRVTGNFGINFEVDTFDVIAIDSLIKFNFPRDSSAIPSGYVFEDDNGFLKVKP